MTRRFIDNDGIFELVIPVTWKYTLMDNYVHTFEDYNMVMTDSFQLSIAEFENETKKKEYAHLMGYLPSIIKGGEDYRSFPDRINEGYVTKMWTTIFADHKITFSITYYNDSEYVLNEKEIESKSDAVFSVIDM